MADSLETRIQLILDDVAAQLAPDAGDFVGRAYVRAKIAEFNAIANRMLVLVGPPGAGKTALAAELVRENLGGASPHLAHFCGLVDGSDPNEFVRRIALQVQAALGADYRLPQTLAKQLNISVTQNIGQATADARVTGVEIKELKLGGVHPRESFRVLVREPLRAYEELRGADRPIAALVMVIDALDRAWEWDGGQSSNIVSVLEDVQDLPEWVNLICTARPGPAVQALRNKAGVRVYDFTEEKGAGDANLADVRAYFTERFLRPLTDEQRERFLRLLAGSSLARTTTDLEAGFVDWAVKASQGNFLFVRRYAAAWRAVLERQADESAGEAEALLKFGDAATSLASALNGSYQTTLTQLRQRIDRSEDDADEAVLSALAIAFVPLNDTLLRCLSGREPDEIAASLERLAPVLAPPGDTRTPTHALFHRGFAEFVRRSRPRGGRDLDMNAARALELADDVDQDLLTYAARYRWPHLLRGLDLGQTAAPSTPAGPAPSAPPVTGDALDWQDHVRQVQAMTRAALTQAQLLRPLAAQALDPSRSDTPGSWTAAVGYLRTAERILLRSRALSRLFRRGGRQELYGAQPPDELLELERTLIALGDTYTTVARRMDGVSQRTDVPPGFTGRLYILWNSVVRLPLTVYLLLVLITQGVREIHIPGALQNLGREQDWAVARLLVLAVSAYRRAGALARSHLADATLDDVAERLARVYMLMGAYDIAAASYENLLARSAALISPWRQAVWLLALGEVLVAQHKPDRAVEVLNSALPTFSEQAAPVLLARAHTALAAAQHQQAVQAEARGDAGPLSKLDDDAIASAGAALTAWIDVTNLPGDDLAAVDPPLVISRVASILRATIASSRTSDEQVRRASLELERVPERHFAQRFEHPVLRLFRVAATVLLPAYILAALLLAIQPRPLPTLPALGSIGIPIPLLNPNSFPNTLEAGGITIIGQLEADDITQIVDSERLRQVSTDLRSLPRQADSLEISARALALVLVYLTFYTIAGVAIVTLVSPTHLQHRRPGRVILRRTKEGRDILTWRGSVSRGTLLDVVEWAREELQLLGARLRPGRAPASPAAPAPEPPPAEDSLALDDVERAITVDRRALGFLLGDFSSITVHTRQGGPARVIPGTIEHYGELSDELRARLGARLRSFGTEIIGSLSGVLFLFAAAYALVLALLVRNLPDVTRVALPAVRYSLADLYVVSAPLIALALVWWFVTQPLAAAIARATSSRRLAITAGLAAALTLAVATGAVGAYLPQLRPDLFTPTLAVATLAALILHGRPRTLARRELVRRRSLALGALTVAAAAGIALVSYDIATTALWYNAKVQGVDLLDQSEASEACYAGEDACPGLASAVRNANTMICLRPGSAEGYELLALTHVFGSNYQAARDEYVNALSIGTPAAAPAAEGCFGGGGRPPTGAERQRLLANLGATHVLHAQKLRDEGAGQEEIELAYSNALLTYATALQLPIAPDREPTCESLARQLMPVPDDVTIDRFTPDADALPAGDTWLVTGLAHACYNRGLMRADLMSNDFHSDRDTGRGLVWLDLASAAAEYQAVAESDDQQRAEALRGMADSWMLLGQLDLLPPEAADRRSFQLRAQTAYAELVNEQGLDRGTLTGQAWSAILLGAWADAHRLLAESVPDADRDLADSAMLGYTSWLESTRYRTSSRALPSPAYTEALREAVDHYTDAIDQSLADGQGDELAAREDRSRAYATRSVLYWSLRNSAFDPDGEYEDADFSRWLGLALADADRALGDAAQAGTSGSTLAGYYYWRGQLSFTLGINWQRKLRGIHSWSEVVPLYASALNDFEDGLSADADKSQKNITYQSFLRTWAPWTRYMLSNAVQMQQAEEAIRAQDWQRARRALELVQPKLPRERADRWDPFSGPRPEYDLAHAIVSLALGIPDDFVNELTGEADPAASYAHALADLKNSPAVPRDAHRAIYGRALADIERLLETPGVVPRARVVAMDARAQIEQAMAERKTPSDDATRGDLP